MVLGAITRSKSNTFLAFCFSFLLGVAGASLMPAPMNFSFLYYLSISLFFLIAFCIIFWKQRYARFSIFCAAFLFFGAGRYMLAFPLPFGDHIVRHAGETMEVDGFIAKEPDIRMDGVRYIVRIQDIDNTIQRLRGLVYVPSHLYPRYEYGDAVRLSCRIETPEPIQDFRYDMYLARRGVFAVCRRPFMSNIGLGYGNPVMRLLLAGKQMISNRVNTLWREPHAGFMAGLLYGYRGGLGPLNDVFNRTGLTHIIAVSGYNISIIASAFIALCIALWIPRKRAFWIVVFGVALFVLFTGATGSVVRAGIMGVLVLTAKQMGRLSDTGRLLVLAAVFMVLHNPFILIWDAGFQLSFLATLGLAYLDPMLQPVFQWVPKTLGIREIVSATLSAIIATLPLILFQFGRLSIVAPVVNALVVWMVPILMAGGAAAVFLSFFPFGWIEQTAAGVVDAWMQYVTGTASWFADLPFASLNVRVPWWAMLAMYALLAWWVLRI